MRKVSVLIGVCMIVGFVLTLAGQEQGLPPIMQENRTTFMSLNSNLTAKNAAAVAADAEKLQGLFVKAGDIFKALKSQSAVDLAKAQADDLGAIAKAAKANNLESAATTAGAVQKRCGACHMAHREQLPDKSFKFKQ